MKILVGAAPVALPSSGRTRWLVQNLGPGKVYFDTEEPASTGTGIEIGVGAVYEFPTSSADDDITLVASAEGTEVRAVRVG